VESKALVAVGAELVFVTAGRLIMSDFQTVGFSIGKASCALDTVFSSWDGLQLILVNIYILFINFCV